jgi:hypothetical protein
MRGLREHGPPDEAEFEAEPGSAEVMDWSPPDE